MCIRDRYEAFCQALHEINVYLAKKIAGDGEGATALFEAKVIGAETKEQAKTLAKSIAVSYTHLDVYKRQLLSG